MEVVKKYATALFGLAIFILAIQAIRTSGWLEAMFAPEVEAGNLSSVDATWFLTIAESVVSFLFTSAVFFFVRLGEGGIAGGKAFFGFKNVSSPAKSNAEAVVDFNAAIRKLYEDFGAKRKEVVTKADADIQSAMITAIEELRKGISK